MSDDKVVQMINAVKNIEIEESAKKYQTEKAIQKDAVAKIMKCLREVTEDENQNVGVL